MTSIAKIGLKLNDNTVVIPNGFESGNANLLTHKSELDPVTGFPAYRGSVVNIQKATE